MPYKKSYAKRRKNKIYKSIRNIVPDTKVVKHRYVFHTFLDPGTGGVASRIMRANSVFDPEYAVGGHQPLGYDEWTQFYHHYNVIGSKCTAKFISADTSGTSGTAFVGVFLSASPTTVADPQLIMEQSTSRYGLMTGSNAAGTSRNIKSYYSPKKFFGLTDLGDNRDTVGAAVDANPVEAAYFHVYATALSSGIDPASMSVLITMDYIVQYSERKTLASS